jgi:hypothetical protein
VDSVEIDRRLEHNADELQLLFRRTGTAAQRPLVEAIAAAQVAMSHANESVPSDTVSAASVQPSPFGPVVFLDLIGDDEQNSTWLTAFAGHLGSEGWSGTLAPAPIPPGSQLPAGFDRAPKPVAFMAFRMGSKPPPGDIFHWGPARWAVDADTTSALCRYLVDWGTVPDAAVRLEMGLSRVEFTDPDVAGLLLWATEHDYRTGVSYVQSSPPVLRRTDLGDWGLATCQVSDDRTDWRSRLEDLRAPLLRFPDRLDLAFVRAGRYWVRSWVDLMSAVPGLPHVTEPDVRLNRRLLDSYVPDAHGLQVLTDEHMSRLGPLPDWDVQPLAGGRHLVQARDLEPWFATTEPDPDVVAAARADFTDILLTPEVIAAHG